MTDAHTDGTSEGTWARLRRRKVVQWGAAYAAGAWALLQGVGFLADAFHWPDATKQVAALVLLIGLPVVLVLAWYHGDRGEQRLSAAELAILTLLFLVGGGIFWRYERTNETASVARPPTSSAPAVVVADDRSIAVLPFVDMSQGHDQEYFSDGISEELLNLLAQVPELRVIARTSSFSFKGKEVDVATIAKALNVANVLEGSVRRSGDTLRITAQLIRASDSSHLWSRTYDRPMTDVFAVQDEIAAAVVAQLKIKLLGAAPKARATDPKAYALFLQAREIGRQYTKEAFEQSIELYRQALALDPAYTAAWVGLASDYCEQVFNGFRSADEGIGLAREATMKALALDPEYAPAHARLGWIALYYDLDLAAAAQHLEHALRLDPKNPDTLEIAATLARRLGRLDQSIAVSEYQIAQDPANAHGLEILSYTYRYAGRLDEAIETLRTVLRLSPGYIVGHEAIGELLLEKGEPEAALAEMQQESLDGARLMGLAMAYHALGRRADSDAALEQLIAKYERTWTFNIAYVIAYRGEADRAFEWLDKAIQYHDMYLGAAAGFPMLASLHKDARWLPLLRRLGMAPEQLAAIKFDVKVPR